MDYDKIAEKVWQDVLNYKVKDESVNRVIKNVIAKHGDFTDSETNRIQSYVIHLMTVAGYDIECMQPFKMKKYN